MPARFLQLHTLTSYPAALLNRDDAGFAKQLPFGSAVRTRISSQCLKRHWRTFDGEHALGCLGEGLSIRSRHIFDEVVLKRLLGKGCDEAKARAVLEPLMSAVLGESAKAKAEKAQAEEPAEEGKEAKKGKAKTKAKLDSLMTGQVVVLGPKEIDHLTTLAEKALAVGARVDAVLTKEERENLHSMVRGAGLDAALFGRMVTSDILARCDAAVHVAHAFTVHAAQTEADYFSAVDDLTSEDGELGAGHINSNDLTSGLYYSYVAIDVPLLVANLTGCELRQDKDAWKKTDRTLAGQVVESLVHTIATTSPGAKLGSTAPHSYAHLMLAEAGEAQPCTLANAFIDPLPTRGDIIGGSYEALAQELLDLDSNYPRSIRRAHLARGKNESRYQRLLSLRKTIKDGAQERVLADPGERKDIIGLAAWAAQQVTA